MIDTLLDLVAPHSCCGCGEIGALLCAECKNDIVLEPPLVCLGCGRMTVHGGMCDPCRRSWQVTDGWLVGWRDQSLKALLDAYKFQSTQSGSKVLAGLLDERLPLLSPGLKIVVVPTAPSHVRARGFDHALRIAQSLGRLRKLPVRPILRRYARGTQHFKGRSERLATAGAGLAVRGVVPETILLIDDIVTTGATLRACTQLLQSAGAKTIYIAVVAKQPLD